MPFWALFFGSSGLDWAGLGSSLGSRTLLSPDGWQKSRIESGRCRFDLRTDSLTLEESLVRPWSLRLGLVAEDCLGLLRLAPWSEAWLSENLGLFTTGRGPVFFDCVCGSGPLRHTVPWRPLRLCEVHPGPCGSQLRTCASLLHLRWARPLAALPGPWWLAAKDQCFSPSSPMGETTGPFFLPGTYLVFVKSNFIIINHLRRAHHGGHRQRRCAFPPEPSWLSADVANNRASLELLASKPPPGVRRNGTPCIAG